MPEVKHSLLTNNYTRVFHMVLLRLEHFNRSEFRSRENSIAISKIEEALLWLRKRTMDRQLRGVEGTYVK